MSARDDLTKQLHHRDIQISTNNSELESLRKRLSQYDDEHQSIEGRSLALQESLRQVVAYSVPTLRVAAYKLFDQHQRSCEDLTSDIASLIMNTRDTFIAIIHDIESFATTLNTLAIGK
jgi:DNA repair exonuclease SbcCD ATPase subunit